MSEQTYHIRVIRLFTVLGIFILLVPVDPLVSHSSQSADLLQKYSVAYGLFLFIYFSFIAVLGAFAILPAVTWERIGQLVVRFRCSSFLPYVWWNGLVVSMVLLAFILSSAKKWELGRNILVQLGIVAAVVWFDFMLLIMFVSPARIFQFLTPMLLVIASVTLTLSMLEILLRTVPRWGEVPDGIRLPAGLPRTDWLSVCATAE